MAYRSRGSRSRRSSYSSRSRSAPRRAPSRRRSARRSTPAVRIVVEQQQPQPSMLMGPDGRLMVPSQGPQRSRF